MKEKRKTLSYEDKMRISYEREEPDFDQMHENYQVPDSKGRLPFWHIKNYFRSMKRNILGVLLWTVISFAVASLISYSYINWIEPWLTNHSWTYLNKYREAFQPAYPYIFGSDGVAHWYDMYGSEYLRGFDEPWQFIYHRYEWIKETKAGVADWQRTRIGFGIYAVFFTFALVSLIGQIVGKIRNHGIKALFLDFVMIPKQVYDYAKRSQKKLFDHFLMGTFIAFIIGFVIKNPFAMPLFALSILISFTMGNDSTRIFNQYASDCAKKLKEGESKPLFADSALSVWGLGTGFLLYSILGYYVWNRAKFAFFARMVETVFWLIIILLIYTKRNGRKSVQMVARGVMVAIFAGIGVGLSAIKAYATVLEIWYDENGNRIGQLIILDNKPNGSSYTNWLSSMRNGGGAGAGGIGAAKNSKKPYRIKSDEEKAKEANDKARDEAREKNIPQMDNQDEDSWNDLNYFEKYRKAESLKRALESAAKGNGDLNSDGILGDPYAASLRDAISNFETRMNTNKLSKSDLDEYNDYVDRVNKYVRGDTDIQSARDWNANPKTPEQQNAKINEAAAKKAALDTAREVGEGRTLASQAVRVGAASLTGGGSEAVVAEMNAGINMMDGVENNRYNSPEEAFVGEATRVAVDNAVGSAIPELKLDMGAGNRTQEVVEGLIQEAANTYVGNVAGDAQDAATGNGSFGDNASDFVVNMMKQGK